VLTDRISSSVYKQGMDFGEINAYRLFESSFPFKVPKYYFGDISNESSNYILILSRIPFAGLSRPDNKGSLRPFQVEGPYGKCRDFELMGDPFEYYSLIMRQLGKVAGRDKLGFAGDPAVCDRLFGTITEVREQCWESIKPGPTGENPTSLLPKIEFAIKFISETGKIIFPDYVTSESFQTTFRNVLMTVSAYDAEIRYWKNIDTNYYSMVHQNLNVDNAYFWKDENGKLDCGVLDFGGFGRNCIGHAVWWVLMAADFDIIKRLPGLMHMLASTYAEYGGPKVNPEILELMVLMTAMNNCVFMMGTISNCLRQCPPSTWSEITDPRDERIWGYIDGKGTLRTTMRALVNQVRIIGELNGEASVERWIRDIWVNHLKLPKKSKDVIWGIGAKKAES